MFERFVLWLTSVFVTNNQLAKHYANRIFKDNAIPALHQIYRHLPPEHKSMLTMANTVLLQTLPISVAVKMLVLDDLTKKLAECTVVDCCRSDILKFFERVVEIQSLPNRLQAMKQMRQHVTANTLYDNEVTIELVAHVLLTQYFGAESSVEYIMQKKEA